jgi:hypothetical protein
MAQQLARLLARSDLAELQEIVAEWRKTAPDETTRRYYDKLGGQLLDLKAELSKQPTEPSEEELAAALTMMMKLAAQQR